MGSFDLDRTATAASIWLSLMVTCFESFAADFATVAFFLVALVVGAWIEVLALRFVLVVVLVAMSVFPVFRDLRFALATIANVAHTVTSEGKPHPADSWQNSRTF